MLFLLKNYSVVESVYLFIRYNKTKFFQRNTDNTDRNSVNKKKTYTPNSQRKITLEMEGPTMSLDAFEFLFFGSVREASNDVNTILNLRFMKKQKPAGFFLRNYYTPFSYKQSIFDPRLENCLSFSKKSLQKIVQQLFSRWSINFFCLNIQTF